MNIWTQISNAKFIWNDGTYIKRNDKYDFIL
eukprot:UN03483